MSHIRNRTFGASLMFWMLKRRHRLIAEEKLEQVNFRTNIEKLTLLEEISWRQKFRVLHLKEGDANTRFFHRMGNSNKKNNGIESLMVNGTLSSD